MKTCIGCKEEKELSEFSRQASTKDGHRGRCKLCTKVSLAVFMADPVKAERTRVGKNAAAKKYGIKNKEKLDAKRALPENRVKANAYMADWYKDPKNKALRLSEKRRRSCPVWADKEAIRDLYMECSDITASTGIPHEVDHIIPIKGKLVSGLHVQNNLQILTMSENRSKSNSYA